MSRTGMVMGSTEVMTERPSLYNTQVYTIRETVFTTPSRLPGCVQTQEATGPRSIVDTFSGAGYDELMVSPLLLSEERLKLTRCVGRV
ncbi:hypothetical protein [Gimesia sp.]|uniref:hypothetical protein n=1 Tax=Gimesia sp. TaxID=2024833 RepID=UPI0025C4CFAE|nr:hypothetical protein [Gimesia sp.]